MKKKALAFAAMACSMAMLLSACGGSSNSNAASGDTAGANIIYAYNSEPQNPLIPSNTNETGGGKPGDLLFSRLVSFDKDGKASNEVAESITPNDDATQYTIKLKSGWKFTDGTDVTAESFTKAWSYAANAKNAQKASSFFSTIKGYDDLQADGLKGDEQLSGLKVVDDTTFTVDLNQSDSVFPVKVGYLAFAPLPESFYKDPKAFGEKPVGNGPYKLDHWDHNKEIALVKNTDYKGNEDVKNDGVTFKVYTDDQAAYRDIQSNNGALDVMESVPAAFTKTFKSDKKIQPYSEAGSVIQTFTIPSTLDHFKNDEEGQLRRQAISMAINREQIIDKVLNGIGTPAVDFTSPKTPGYSDSLKGSENLKFDAAKAKELWAKADAISKFDGQLTFSYNADGGAKPIYDAIVNQLKNNLGIDAATNPIPTFQEFRDAITNRQMTGAFRTGWQPDYPSAENYLWQLYSSAAADGTGSNDGDYKNPDFDALCLQAAAAKSTDEANKLYQQAQEILLKDLPAIPLYYSNASGVASLSVKSGFGMDWQNLPTYTEMSKK
ncbi:MULTISPECIES: ABC transporter substrate-binding protein [unclassified Bifidobacterium]|uniref:peptide ABC transporter substrate-binding protein n=1 Tax=unclassified Bifidobacterium TaxID=2608897 RepID=UPI00112B9D27|nr:MULTISPECIES: ABC transporter substrate-binding protein [unclassified Bifidobacterium]TPF78171.1 ABC transporter substrate-binding protein [Bifidobacterium sp. UTCIF-1]TPF81130.1 ABC transporter substrate-binding protein [Bifidobacterium sp. UTCIF-24]TPF82135.1 ABC transporter substrate-binding protein [Bifidobacterium sp. UTCIF-3]TPF85242.1 ABC transporter substrate-binding protein [Bifidobacterium sp. UTCIF-36]TPF91078.1 ABC transporter substrate-binding protein [Bifidobacterium sp. UTBIF